MKDLLQSYQTLFGDSRRQPVHIFAPYAVCPLGAHVDHQLGMVSGFALDKGIDLLFVPTETGKVVMSSASFAGLQAFLVGNPVYEKQHNWGDYLRGAVWALQRDFPLHCGIRGILKGSIPSGGIASSAALLCGFIMALDIANDLKLTRNQVVQYASMAERLYIGLNNGILDQSCVTLSGRNKLLYINTSSSDYRLLPFGTTGDDAEVPFRVGIFFSGVTDALTNTDYNLRVQECRTAAWMLQAYAEQPLKKLEETTLHDISSADFARFEYKMPPRFARRARHYFYENSRVTLGRQAWQQGDIQTFGQLMFDSCESSIQNYECGAPELIALYRILRQTDGVYGARFSGPGFLGSCIALTDPAKEEQIKETVGKAYKELYPQHADKYEAYFCNTHEQAGIVTP